MDCAHRKVGPLGIADHPAIYVSAGSSVGIGANVLKPVHLLGHPLGHHLPFLRSFSTGLFECVRVRPVAAWSMLLGSSRWHDSCHSVRPHLAPQLRALGTELPENNEQR